MYTSHGKLQNIFDIVSKSNIPKTRTNFETSLIGTINVSQSDTQMCYTSYSQPDESTFLSQRFNDEYLSSSMNPSEPNRYVIKCML